MSRETRRLLSPVKANKVEDTVYGTVLHEHGQGDGIDEYIATADELDALVKIDISQEAEKSNQYLSNAAPDGNTSSAVTLLSICYMLAMGVCGIVLVALGSTLSSLANNIGVRTTRLGTVFIARGVGAVIGAISSAKLYKWFHGNTVMATSMMFIFIILLITPYNRTFYGIHFLFFFFGLNTSITDTGCQIMTRKLHGKAAGPWLGANTVAFGISGALVPLLEMITRDLYYQYFLLAACVLAISALLVFTPDPNRGEHGKPNGPPARPGHDKAAPHYHVEYVVSFMVFCFIGGNVTSTAYLDTYVDDSGILPVYDEAKLVLVLWIAVTVGRLAGVQDQRFLTNKTLPIHLSILTFGGFLSILLILWFPVNREALWIGVAFFGLFNGPCVGYCYDWNNRITFPSEASMSIVMFGLNLGASLVPYVTTFLWDHGAGENALLYVLMATMIIPLPLLHMTRFLSYDPNVNPALMNQTHTDSVMERL